MSREFDPYHKWLGIALKDQPPHHYRLLGIDPFEDDRDVIDAAANRVMSYLKDIATGDEAAHSQRLLNEVARARVCLLNRERKAAYDKELRAKLSARKPAKQKRPAARSATQQPTPGPLPMSKPKPPTVEPLPVGIRVEPEPVTLSVDKTWERRRDEGTPPWLFVAIGAGILVAALAILIVFFALRSRDEIAPADPEPGPKVATTDDSDSSRDNASDTSSEEPSEIAPIVPPAKVQLFTGTDLTGWQGWVGNRRDRTDMSSANLVAAQTGADEKIRRHWKVVNDVLIYDGQGEKDGALYTVKDYGDFELFVDWKIESGGDSGIYLRGTPQVQIWDVASHLVGSGGLFNNENHQSSPLAAADNPVGQWNSFRIKMIGERVSVWLNDVLVVDNEVMENYWERDKPIYDSGPIGLQQHRSKSYFRNIYVREIPRQEVVTAKDPKKTAQNSHPIIQKPATVGISGPPRRVALTELNTPQTDAYPWISPDGLSLYWTREGSGQAVSSIWTATRRDPNSPFQNSRKVMEGRHASLTGDQLEIVLLGGQSRLKLHYAKRPSLDQPFPPIKPMAEFDSEPSPKSPFISPDGRAMLFQRRGARPGLTEFAFSVRRSPRGGWTPPHAIPMNVDRRRFPDALTWPSTTANGLDLWFCNGGGKTPQIMTGRRNRNGDPYRNFQLVQVNGELVIGRCPRHSASTRELFFCATPSPESDDWDLYVIKGFVKD